MKEQLALRNHYANKIHVQFEEIGKIHTKYIDLGSKGFIDFNAYDY